MHFTKTSLVVPGVVTGASAAAVQGRGSKPSLPYDPNTISNCNWRFDNKSDKACQTILDENFITRISSKHGYVHQVHTPISRSNN